MLKYIFRRGDYVWLSTYKPRYLKTRGYVQIKKEYRAIPFDIREFRTLSNFPANTPVDGCLYVMDHDTAGITIIEVEGHKI